MCRRGEDATDLPKFVFGEVDGIRAGIFDGVGALAGPRDGDGMTVADGESQQDL